MSAHRRAHAAGRRGQAPALTARHEQGRHLWRIALATWKRLGFDFSVPVPPHAES